MLSTRWLQKRRPYWARVDELVTRSEKSGIRALNHRELRELAVLYRQAASDLSAVREDPASQRLAQSLNQLLGRAHNCMYMGKRRRSSQILTFYRYAFPQIFHDTLPYTMAACAIFFALAAAGFAMAILDPGFQLYFLGGGMMDSINRHQMWTHSIVSIKPLASSEIMTNNLSVSFVTFAFGITAGIGTLYMLAFNGLLFGVVNAACWQTGMSGQLLSFVAPHGVLELPAIFIAGGAGFLIAKGLLFPGVLPRRASVVREGRRAIRLVLGIIPLLIVAGTVEGFVSPTELAVKWKYLLAAILLLLLLLFVIRKTPPAPKTQTSGLPAPSA
ncbi:MAG: stage II sporulation protein M [Candidatus Acidiferrales bacterium]